MKKKSVAYIIFILIFARAIFSENLTPSFLLDKEFSLWGGGEVFKCTPALDIPIMGTGALILGTDLILAHGVKLNRKEFDGKILDKNDVNKFDRFFMNSYSKPLDITADVLMITAIATPAILLATEDISEWMTIATMYGETILLSQGIKEISKLFINRARPYMYYEGFPEKDVYEKFDWNNSCPSGHSTTAFASATFFSYVFCKYNPKSAWRFPVIIGSYALATTTAILRVCSGNHFPTDIIFGAALGSGIGFLVPFLHTLTTSSFKENKTSSLGTKSRFQVEVLPLGINLCVKL